MPWALLATDRAVRGVAASVRQPTDCAVAQRRSALRALTGSVALRPWILLTLVFSLQFLAAEPFTLLVTFGLCLAYALYLRGTRRPLASPANFKVLTAFLLVGCLMIALCAVQFLPSAELLSHSRRGAQGLRYGETSNWSFHPLLLAEMLVPEFYGPALIAPTSWNTMVGDGNSPYFISVFMGFVPLFFALAGWALGRDRRRNFVAGSALLLLVLSFGHLTPVFSLAYLLVPLLTLVRFPVKLLVPVILLLAILAGWGLDTLREDPERWKARRNRALYPLAILLACSLVLWAAVWTAPKLITQPTRWALFHQGHASAEAGRMADFLAPSLRLYAPGVAGFILFGFLLLFGLARKKRWARPAVPIFALLGLAHLVLVNYDTNPSVPKTFYTYQPPVVSHFQGSAGTYRVASMARLPSGPSSTLSDLQSFVNFDSIPGAAGLSAIAQGTFQQRLLLAEGSMLSGVEGSLNLDIERSLPPFVYDVWIYMLRQAPDAFHIECLLGRTNVRYFIRPTRRDSPGTTAVSEIFNGSAIPSYLYEDLYYVPRAYAAGTSVFSTSPIETLSRMARPDFDAQGSVILAAEPGDSPAVRGSGPAGRVEITSRQPSTVTLEADLTQPGYVVLLDRYDSNWHASIDGREVPVLRANQLFRAVYVEPDRHVILFYFRQRGLLAGILISSLTLVIILGVYMRTPGSNASQEP